jgi:hypothetical protein
MRYALGYKTANPELKVSLLLNAASAVELARLCPWLDETYAIPFTEFMEVDTDPAEALAGVPREWDWVVENHRARERSHAGFPGFRAFFDAAHAHFEPRNPLGIAGSEPPAYTPHQQLRFDLPPDARAAAAAIVGAARPVIAIVPAGSSAHRHLYPSTASWELILRALSERYPEAAFPLIGKLTNDRRTTTRVTRAELERLLAAVPATIDCFDRPLSEQVALLETSDLLVSPHTGFSFVASAVGTPWLAISGGNWHEYFFNGEPVYSLLPDPQRYPSFAWAELGETPLQLIDDEDGEGPRTPSMSIARIREDLPELIHASELLIEQRRSYEDLLAEYFPRLLAAYAGDRSRAFSFDNIGELYFA